MKIEDQGIILSVKKYSENSLIVKILSENHGICRGFVRQNSKKNNSIYQAANLVEFSWQARTEDQLGLFRIEPVKSFLADIFSDQIRLNCLISVINIIEQNILERDSHPELFEKLSDFLKNLGNQSDIFLAKYILLEIELLQILGYGIDLSECAATGATINLVFVSPKSGRAVSFEAGEKYQDKLLKLPKFLIDKNLEMVSKNDLLSGLELSGFFINKYLIQPLKPSLMMNRGSLIELVKNL